MGAAGPQQLMKFLTYKSQFLTFALLLGYAYMHVNLTGMYVDADLEHFIHFTARLPFGQRLLIPLLAYYLTPLFSFTTSETFFLLEWIFVSLLYFALKALLSTHFSLKEAKLLSWLFIFLLALVTLINYGYTADRMAPLNYPYDIPSLFFITLGFLLCLQARWYAFIPLLGLATLNRESSILLVFMILALHSQQAGTVYKPFIMSLLTFAAVRLWIVYFTKDLPGQFMELRWAPPFQEHTHLEINFVWLLDKHNLLFFLFCLAGLPLFWFAFYDYIPLRYRPLRYLMLAYFLGLLLLGNFMEARIFCELLVLLYFPVCIALSQWLGNQPMVPVHKEGWTFYLNRYAILTILLLVALFRVPLNHLVLWLSF